MADNDFLPTALWVSAVQHLCDQQNIAFYIVNKGEAERGTILVRVCKGDGTSHIWIQTRNAAGQLVWTDPVGKNKAIADMDATAYCQRACSRDPDLWVIDIDDKNGANPFQIMVP